MRILELTRTLIGIFVNGAVKIIENDPIQTLATGIILGVGLIAED